MHNITHVANKRYGQSGRFRIVQRSALTLVLIAFAFGAASHAQEIEENKDAPVAIAETLQQLNQSYSSISQSPMEGMYEIEADGTLMYASRDGKYILVGDLIMVDNGVVRNLSDERKRETRVELLAALDPLETINFGSDSPDPKVIHVFTDVDCGYCRVLHRNMSEYIDEGFEIRYLAYPRSGLDTESYFKIASAWCSDDRESALTQLKNGREIPRLMCDNPIADHLALGRTIGITGTPALLLPDGRLVPGAVSAEQLAQIVAE